MKTDIFILLAAISVLISCGKGSDVCIYGGGSACVTAAYSAAPEDKPYSFSIAKE